MKYPLITTVAIHLILVNVILVQLFPFATSENILFYFAITGYSHMNSIWPLIDKLVEKGHNITLFTSADPQQKHNDQIKVIISTEIQEVFSDVWEKGADLIKERQSNRQHNVLDPIFEISLKTCETFLRSTQTKDLIFNSHFDLVIIDEDANQCGMALAHYKYKSPFMFYSAFTFFGFMYDEFGVPLETSSIPDAAYGLPLTFWERLRSTLSTLWWTYHWQHTTFQPMEALVKEVFNLEETPSISDLYKRTSLVLLNTHPSTDYARSLPPLFVSVAGMHIREERQPLGKDLADFISKSGSLGFIYVSFGTSVQIYKSHPEIRQKFFDVMGNMSSYQFVWKWEGEFPSAAPPNILFSNWLPQQDLYAHKDIKGAITHCGINGMHEAVYFKVPLIMFPICYEQDFNAYSMASKGLGIKLELSAFTQEELQAALREILTNNTIKENLSRTSKLFKDRPMNPTDTALWWVEHILRNKNSTQTQSLVPLAKWQTWYERRLLDIWLFVYSALLLIISLLSTMLYKIIPFVIKQFLRNNASSESIELLNRNSTKKRS